MKVYTDIQDLIELAKEWDDENEELDCNIVLVEDDIEFKAYTCSIAHRELMFYCDKGCLVYVVDTIGKDYLVCYDIQLDEAV